MPKHKKQILQAEKVLNQAETTQNDADIRAVDARMAQIQANQRVQSTAAEAQKAKKSTQAAQQKLQALQNPDSTVNSGRTNEVGGSEPSSQRLQNTVQGLQGAFSKAAPPEASTSSHTAASRTKLTEPEPATLAGPQTKK